MIDATRRILLKGSLAAGAVGVAIAAGLLAPRRVLAEWSRAGFEAKDVSAALKGLLGSDAAEQSDAIKLTVPDIAEKGDEVPVTVETTLPGVKSISILAAENPTPLVASFEIGEAAMPYVSTRIKMAKTADVIAIVKTGDKVYRNAVNVQVTKGGCGG